MKDEHEGTIMTEFLVLILKTYVYLMDDGNSDKKSKKEMCNKKNT